MQPIGQDRAQIWIIVKVYGLANSADVMPRFVTFHLVLHCLITYLFMCFQYIRNSWQG